MAGIAMDADRADRRRQAFSACGNHRASLDHRENPRGRLLRTFDHRAGLAARDQLPGFGVTTIGIDLLDDLKLQRIPGRDQFGQRDRQ